MKVSVPSHVLALSLGTLVLGIAEFGMMAILSATAEDLGVSIPDAGNFISSYATGVCAGVVLMVLFARRIPYKRLLLIILGLMFAGNAVTVFSPNYAVMMVSRFVAGLPHGAFFGAGAIVAAGLAKPGCASRDVCLMSTGMTVANLIGVPLGCLLAWAVSWRCVFVIIAALAAADFFAVRRYVPAVPAAPDRGFAAQFRFLRHPQPWLVLAAIGLGNGGFFSYYSYVNPTLKDVAGLSPEVLPLAVAFAGFGMVAGNLCAAKLSLRFSIAGLAAGAQFSLCCALVAVFFLAPWCPAAIFLTAFCAGSAFFMGGPEQVLILENSKEGQLLAASLAQCSFNAGNAVGAWLGGLPIESGKTAEWSALPGVGLAFAGFLCLFAVWFVRNEKSRERRVCSSAAGR